MGVRYYRHVYLSVCRLSLLWGEVKKLTLRYFIVIKVRLRVQNFISGIVKLSLVSLDLHAGIIY